MPSDMILFGKLIIGPRQTHKNSEEIARSPSPSHTRGQAEHLVCKSYTQAAYALARNRARHHESAQPRFQDAYAVHLAGALTPEESPTASGEEEEEQHDVAATAYIDQQVLTALDLVDLDLKKEYRQVVLLGCGFDTRPYRLLWPEGTIIYEIAPSEAHTVAYKALKEHKASVSRGSLFRRVPWDFKEGTSFAAALQRAGHQGGRLSVWGIQGLAGMSLTDAALRDLINQVSLSSAFGSIVIGELPPMARQQADNMLAEHMLLGVVRPILEGKAQEGIVSQRWLFTTQHKQLSADEVDLYERHSQAGEEIDEDFFDNFS